MVLEGGMVEQLDVGNAEEGIDRTVDGIGKVARAASSQFAGRVGNVKDAARGRVEKLTVKGRTPTKWR